MRTETCGGVVEVQAFFCQYFFTKLSSALAYAITINGGDKIIVKNIGEGEVITVGNPKLTNADLNLNLNTTTAPWHALTCLEFSDS